MSIKKYALQQNVCGDAWMEEDSLGGYVTLEDHQAELAAATAEVAALRRVSDGMVANVRHMVGRCNGTDAALLWELGQWAVNLKSWADEYAAIAAAKQPDPIEGVNPKERS